MAQLVKNPPAMQETACSTVDLGLIPGSGRSPGEGNGNPLQYSYLGNPMGRGTWQATVHGGANSQTWLSDQKTMILCGYLNVMGLQHASLVALGPGVKAMPRPWVGEEDLPASSQGLGISGPHVVPLEMEMGNVACRGLCASIHTVRHRALKRIGQICSLVNFFR